MSNAIDNLLSRRSIRKYTDRQVPDELLDQVLKAGIYAPSGMNTQVAMVVAVRDKQTRDQLSRMNAQVLGKESDPFYGAPCVIVVLADPDRYKCWVEDGSLVIGNLMNAAHALGLGSCWVNRARQMFDTEEGKELREAGITAPILVFGITFSDSYDLLFDYNLIPNIYIEEQAAELSALYPQNTFLAYTDNSPTDEQKAENFRRLPLLICLFFG